MNANSLNELENALTEMKVERDKLAQEIVGLEGAIKRLRGAQQNAPPPRSIPGLGKYANKGITETCLDILQESKKRLSTRQIIEAAMSHGFVSSSKKLSNLFYGILRRASKENKITMIQESGKTFFEAKDF